MATTQQALTPTGNRLITADELLKMHSKGKRGELIRGEFIPKMPAGEEHGAIVVNLAGFLREVVRPNRLGRLVASDSGVRVESNPDTVREPDIAFISSERRPQGTSVPGYTEIPPDLVVEVVSPSDRQPAINDKARMWVDAGVRLVWVLWPETKMIEIHRAGEPVTTLREADTLTGMDVIPQFTCPVRDIFDTWGAHADDTI